MSSLESTRCVVLNTTYEPITIIPAKRALILFLEGKATIVEEHPALVVRSPSQSFPLPTSIVLKEYVRGRRVYNAKALLTQRNLFVRDRYTCQYCLRHKSVFSVSEKLTRDHVVPRDLGGRDVWTNVVACCSSCNNKKANYALKDTNLTLNKKPTVPTIFELWSLQHSKSFK